MADYIYSYNQGSAGAAELARSLGIRRIRHENSRYTGRTGDRIINWGSSNLPDFGPAVVVNPASTVRTVGNKLTFFQLEHDARMPRFSADRSWAENELRNGGTIVCRRVLTGHSGNGIIIAERLDQLVDAPLYTDYVKKQAEYRVHIVCGSIVDIQRKIRDPDREVSNWQVRSHSNGFIYVRNGIEPPEDVRTQALRAFETSRLDFGAVDVIWNEHERNAYVLEINTAPGLTGQTVTNYVAAFKEHILG